MKRMTGEELKAALERKRAFYRECVVAIPDSMPEVQGIFVGGCVTRGVGSSFRAKAHAHNTKNSARCFDIHSGWICIRSLDRIGQWHSVPQNDGTTLIIIDKPSRLLIHEYAHVLTLGHSHDDAWRRAMKRLGQPITKQYEKHGREEWADRFER